MRRFYSPDAGPGFASVTLSAEESAHATGVLRLGPGDRVAVFNGLGQEFLCEVASAEKKAVTVTLIEEIDPPASESPLDLTLAAALLKLDKYDLVVQKAVELGVTRLIPIVSARCEIPSDKAEKRSKRWERIVIEASKQCGRARLMEIGEVREFPEFISGCDGSKLIFAERGGAQFPAGPINKLSAVTGPEGGWEESELSLAEASGFVAVTLGARILRAETAAITAASLVQHRYGDLN